MKLSKVWITDYIKNPHIEQEILGEQLAEEPHEQIEVLLVWHENINAAFMARFPNLRAIIRYGVGFDNIDIDAARQREIFVCNTPDYGTEEVADTAIAMILALTRGLFGYQDIAKKIPRDWQENTLQHLRRSRALNLGVIGAGRIGSAVLLRAQALNFHTHFFDPYKESGYEKVLAAKRAPDLQSLLELADIISLHCPLTEETRGLVDIRFLQAMKPGCFLINTARGKILQDLDLLVTPLQEKHLAAVALDVLPEEPPSFESRLIQAWKNDADWLRGRLIINPHTAYFSRQAYREMRAKAAQNAMRIIEGKTPVNRVRTSYRIL